MSAQGIARDVPHGWRRFVREVSIEMRKVDWPTQRELATFSVVVLVTVAALTAFVAALDLAFARALFGVLS